MRTPFLFLGGVALLLCGLYGLGDGYYWGGGFFLLADYAAFRFRGG